MSTTAKLMHKALEAERNRVEAQRQLALAYVELGFRLAAEGKNLEYVLTYAARVIDRSDDGE